MNIREILSVMGTDHSEVLAYFLFPAGFDLAAAGSFVRARLPGRELELFPLESEGQWPSEVMLVEAKLSHDALAAHALAVLSLPFEQIGGRACVLMPDACFWGIGTLLTPQLARLTYGMRTEGEGPVLALSDDVLTSPHWAAIVAAQRASLVERGWIPLAEGGWGAESSG